MWSLELFFSVFGNHYFYSEKNYNNIERLKKLIIFCKYLSLKNDRPDWDSKVSLKY